MKPCMKLKGMPIDTQAVFRKFQARKARINSKIIGRDA